MSAVDMDGLDRDIINLLQDGMDVVEEPFSEISKNLGITEEALISRISKLLEARTLSRFGPLFNAGKLGGGLSLAAIKVPEDNFDIIAEKVNSFEEVAHNYARDHEYNMWFVLATERPERIDEVIVEIEQKTGLKVLNLPKIEEFFVGLRFVV